MADVIIRVRQGAEVTGGGRTLHLPGYDITASDGGFRYEVLVYGQLKQSPTGHVTSCIHAALLLSQNDFTVTAGNDGDATRFRFVLVDRFVHAARVRCSNRAESLHAGTAAAVIGDSPIRRVIPSLSGWSTRSMADFAAVFKDRLRQPFTISPAKLRRWDASAMTNCLDTPIALAHALSSRVAAPAPPIETVLRTIAPDLVPHDGAGEADADTTDDASAGVGVGAGVAAALRAARAPPPPHDAA